MNCPHWLLALTIPFSRSDRAHTSPAGVGAGCSKDGSGRIALPEGFLRLPEGQGRPFRRECHSSRRETRASTRPSDQNHRAVARSPKGRPGLHNRDFVLTPIVAGHPPRPADARPNGPVPSVTGRCRRTRRWHAGSRRSACHPGARSSTGFPPPPCRQPGAEGSVRRLLMSSIYRMSPGCDGCMMNRRCCTAVTGR